MTESNGQSLLSILGIAIYILVAIVISAILFFIMSIGISLIIEHMTAPSEAFKVLGFSPEAGIGYWFIRICDHVIRILIISVSSTFILSIGLNAFNQIPNDKVYLICYSGYVVIMLCFVGAYFLTKGLSSQELVPNIDIFLSLCLIGVFCFFFFMTRETPTIKDNFKSLWGIAVASIISIIILYFTLAIAIYANMLSLALDIWTYVDMFIGPSWDLLHTALGIYSHIQNILFLGATLGTGLFLCSKAIERLVPAKKTADFFQSSVTLWSLEFLLYAITDENSMKQALIDKYDFSVVTLIIAIFSILALFGGYRELSND